MFIDKKLITTNRSGFTLVELIVVISILAILGTIAFLSFGWYSASARDAKRSQNLDDIAKAMTIGQANGVSIASYVSAGVGALDAAAGWLTGSSALVDYNGGSVNTTALGLKSTDYQDPSSNDDYKIWVTGSSFELAATMETLVNGGKATRVLWNFRSRTTTDSAATVTAWTWTSIVTIETADIGKLKVSDTVSDGTGTWTIANISADGTKLTLSFTASATAAELKLAKDEVAWLVGDITDAKIPVTDRSTTSFPYTVN